MLRTKIIFLLFTLSSLNSFAFSDTNKVHGPRIEFEKTTFDFGFLTPRKKAVFSHAFIFRNTGDQNLNILALGDACLTKAYASREEIPPGQKAYITIISKPNAGHASVEDFRRHIQIQTNDPEHRGVELVISATFAYSLKPDPIKIDFDLIRIGQSSERTICLESRSENPFKIKEIIYNDELFDVRITSPTRKTIQSGMTTTTSLTRNPIILFSPDHKQKTQKPSQNPAVHIQVRVKPTALPGSFTEMLLVKTDRADIPEISIPLSGKILSHLNVEPKDLFLGVIRSQKVIKKTIRIRSDNPNFSIKEIQNDTPGLTTLLQKKEDGYLIHVTIDPLRAKKRINTQLTLETNSTATRTIQIPIRGMVHLPPNIPLTDE